MLKNKKSIKLNMIMKKIILLFIFLVPITAKAQLSVMDREYSMDFIGLTGGIGLVSYNGTLSFFSDQVDCEPYNFSANSGSQANVLFGLRAEYKISKQFYLYGSLLYEDRSSKFDPINCPGFVYVDDSKPFEAANLNQELETKINVFSISPMIRYKPFNFDLGFVIGPSFALIISDELNAMESIIQPEELYYTNGEKKRVIHSGKIESKNTLLVDLKFGLSYGYMLTEQVKLSPEIFYVLPLTNITAEGDWKISSIQILLSLSYGF